MNMNPQKPWLKNYLEGVPHEIDLAGYASIVELLETSFAKYPHRIAIESMGYSISYRQLDILSKDFAAYLQTLGLDAGARIAIMFPNVPQYLITMVGALRAGFTVVNINPLYTARELEHQLHDSGASVLAILENFAHVYQEIANQALVKKVIVSSLGESLGPKGVIVNLVARHIKKLVPKWHFPAIKLNQALKIGSGHGFNKVKLAQDDIAFLQYTGGTTGVSKGAVLSHQNILANIVQIESWLEPALQNRQQQLVFLCALPMTHIFALTACALLGIRKGSKLLLVANPRDITGFIKFLIKHPDINIFPGVNTLFHALIHRPEFNAVKLPNLLVTIGGGMAVQKKTADLWQKLTGVPIAQGYGLSETSPVVCVNTPFIKEFTGSIGMPVPSTDVVILDDDEVELPFGMPGEICIKGPQVMSGYWNRSEEETNQFFTTEGYFKSGDIGTMSPEGYVQIVDRKKDMIVVAGFKVFPNEIEELISSMPGVRECAVIGFPHRKLGEIVKAYIVKDKLDLTEAQVIQYCKEQMSSYKRPRKIAFIDEMPKSNVGKILRRHLRDL
jgi:long-chain acyl-CoA synthetase